MAERERHLKSFIEVEEEQRLVSRCDFSKLTAPLREYRVTQRSDMFRNEQRFRIVLYRTLYGSLGDPGAKEEINVFESALRQETRWALIEASEAVDAAKKLYEARNK